MVAVVQIKVNSIKPVVSIKFLNYPIYKLAKFWTNPQFFIKLTDVDQNDNENKATIVVALMQKDSRLKRTSSKKDSAEEFIQFKLFKV